MKTNMGTIDKVIRIIVAALFSYLYFTQKVVGGLGMTLLVVGGIFLVTSLISFCPLYTLLGINTSKK
jgi:hypothetical protein